MLRSTVKMLALLASLSFVVACGGDDGDGGPDCTDTMAQMRGSAVIMGSCLGCHSTTATDRQSAPPNINFDTPADITAHEDRIRARAIDKNPTPMPPPAAGTLGANQISDLEAFLDCR